MSTSLRVIEPGPLDSVQDLGRAGHGASGVPIGGAADALSIRVGNRLVGNEDDAASIEMTLVGGTYAFDSPALEPGDCAQSLIAEASTGDNVPRIPVVPGETIGISVDPVVADSGWSPVIGQQRLVSTPLETTYYRFTYPDLQEIPPDGILLQVVAGRGDAAKGIWVFRLERA